MMRFKYTFLIIVLIIIASVIFLPAPGQAIDTGLKTTAGRANLDFEAGPAEIVGGIIYTFLSILGIVLLGLIMYAGVLWMTAGGDEQQVKKAKDWIINAIIGVAIILSAYAITSYVIDRMVAAQTPAPEAPAEPAT